MAVEKQKHMVDKMFLIVLFATFSVCAFGMIMIGAKVYSHTASVMNNDYEKRVDISYVTEKIRQWDEENSIEITTFHKKTALMHIENINGMTYLTYIYQDKGALRELMVRKGIDTKKMQGEKIISAKDFMIYKKDKIYDIEIRGRDGQSYKTCVYRHSKS